MNKILKVIPKYFKTDLKKKDKRKRNSLEKRKATIKMTMMKWKLDWLQKRHHNLQKKLKRRKNLKIKNKIRKM